MGRRIYLLLIVLAISGYASQPLNAQSPPGKLAQHSTIRFELFHDYLIVLQGQAGPLRGLNFLLDTGATPSVLDRRVAARLHLASAPTEIAVLDGSARAAIATLPSLRVGPVTRSNLPVLVENLSFIQKVLPVRLDGIVGLDILGATPFVVDYVSDTIRFEEADLPYSVPLHIDRGRPILGTQVNGHPARLLLDTGSPLLVLFTEEAPATAHATLVSTGTIGDHGDQKLQLNSLRLGSAMILHPSALAVAAPGDAGHTFAGILSPAALGLRQVGIDLQRGEMAFSR